ncbi:recombinase family protein [Acidobacteria bacterium AH-259-L09]|nr:recombinase family protein [Acidobacteria bacterium AH-259-L09]
METNQKVNAGHLKRNAYLYIRQSTPRQVLENSESTRRQYALRQRALALGWASEQIIVIDTDLGQSGASAADREGFQRLVSEVGIGRAGIVLGLEVSRLARNSADWHRLLEICALTDTLILDEDGIYDPSHFNDRLLLGLKGTMSEAELHVMRARMRGGVLNKARRGELALPLPIGLVYDTEGQVILDPDRQVQQSIQLLFATFRRAATACATVRSFREQGLLFPRRPRGGPGKGQLLWVELTHSHVIQILRNPRYAGAFVYGRTRTRKKIDGSGRSTCVRQPREQWHALLLDAHPGYIAWEEYEENLRRLRENAQAYGGERRKSPPREGPALLQGLVLCGICGKGMTVGYHVRQQRLVPEYLCQQEAIARAEPVCQRIAGAGIDQAVGQLLMEVVTPVALEVTLAVQQEIQSRWQEADRLRQTQVDRARYEANLAQRRYLQVDPDNRLVADVLEADWNNQLRALEEAQRAYERQRQADREALGEEQQGQILALAADFPRLWKAPNLPDRERKRMVRLILEDVTLTKRELITMHVRFKGGATKTIQLPIPPRAWEKFRTSPEVVREIDRLLDHYTDQQIADIFNERGEFRPGKAQRFNRAIIRRIEKDYGLKSRYDRLREVGMLTHGELAQLLGISPQTVRRWWKRGFLKRYPYNSKQEYLYEHPGPAALAKKPGFKLSERRRLLQFDNHCTNEVQYEA